MRDWRIHVGDLLRTLAMVVLGFLFSLLLLVMISDEPDHTEMYERQSTLIQQNAILICLALTENPDPVDLAGCQAEAATE